MKENSCCYCAQVFEPGALRPYGPKGALTCYPCMKASPEREALAGALVVSKLSAPGVHVIATTGITTLDIGTSSVSSTRSSKK